VPEIYEATIDTGHWDYVMAMIAKLTKSQSACLYYKDKELGFANAVAQYGLEDKMGRDIEHHLDRFDSLFESDAGLLIRPLWPLCVIRKQARGKTGKCA
jgi:hypothetical protein